MYFFRLSISMFALNMLFFRSLLFEFAISVRLTCSLAWKMKYFFNVSFISNKNPISQHAQLWATLRLLSTTLYTCSTEYFSLFASIYSADSSPPNTRSCSNRYTIIPATEGERIRLLCARYLPLILAKAQPNCRAVYRCNYRCTLGQKEKKWSN